MYVRKKILIIIAEAAGIKPPMIRSFCGGKSKKADEIQAQNNTRGALIRILNVMQKTPPKPENANADKSKLKSRLTKVSLWLFRFSLI